MMVRVTALLLLTALSFSSWSQLSDSSSTLPSGETSIGGGAVGDFNDRFLDAINGSDLGGCSGGTLSVPWKTAAVAGPCLNDGDQLYIMAASDLNENLVVNANNVLVGCYFEREDGYFRCTDDQVKPVLNQITGTGANRTKDGVLVEPWFYANAEGPLGAVGDTASQNEVDPGVLAAYPPAYVFTATNGPAVDTARVNEISAYNGGQVYKHRTLASLLDRRIYRSEITTWGYDRGQPGFVPYTEDREYWYGMAMWFPAVWPIDDQDLHNDGVVVINSHQEVGDPEAAPAWGMTVREDGSMRAHFECAQCAPVNGQFNYSRDFSPARNIEDYDETWIRIVIYFKASKTGQNGGYRIWMNDVLVHEDMNRDTVSVDTAEPFYIKWGLYPSYTNYRDADADGFDEKIFFSDEIRYGHSGLGHGYEDVDPAAWLNN